LTPNCSDEFLYAFFDIAHLLLVSLSDYKGAGRRYSSESFVVFHAQTNRDQAE